jgi:hypothetical protein
VIWQIGALFGIILGVIQLVFLFFLNGVIPFAGIINIIVSAIVLFFAGYLAAQKTFTVGTGALAGLVAGAISGIIGLIVSIIVVLVNPELIQKATNIVQQSGNTGNLSQGDIQAAIMGGLIIAFIIGLLFLVALGAGVGAIGGVVGKQSTPHNDAPPTPVA